MSTVDIANIAPNAISLCTWALIVTKKRYFQEDSKDNRESFKNSIIDFHRVEFAIDLCAFIKKLPEAQGIE